MKSKQLWSYVLFFLPTLIIFFILLYFSDLKTVGKTLAAIPIYTYVIVFLIYILSWLLRGERWRSMLKQNKVDSSLIASTGLSAFGNYANWIVPARIGDLGWAYAAKKVLKTRFSISFVTIALNRFLDFF